jgi:hypothetical protein
MGSRAEQLVVDITVETAAAVAPATKVANKPKVLFLAESEAEAVLVLAKLRTPCEITNLLLIDLADVTDKPLVKV